MADGSLPLAEETQGRRRQMLRTAFGPTIAAALADPSVIEVMVNPDGKLWIERAAIGRRFTGERLGAAEAERSAWLRRGRRLCAMPIAAAPPRATAMPVRHLRRARPIRAPTPEGAHHREAHRDGRAASGAGSG
jgi:hypothetical protein